MLDITGSLILKVKQRLRQSWRHQFADSEPERIRLLEDAVHDALLRIGDTDALYHNQEHTAHVTITADCILEGKVAAGEPVSAHDWLHVTLSCLYHDIGIVRGTLLGDLPGDYATGIEQRRVQLQVGASDAAMIPYHVDRGKHFVTEQYDDQALLDLMLVQACIERTRFPVPDTEIHHTTDDLPGLVRAADLIGQLADPRYLCKLNALFWEFDETGLNKVAGYHTPDDVRNAYPWFYENMVAPYIGPGLGYLERTTRGRKVLRSLKGNYAQAAAGAKR